MLGKLKRKIHINITKSASVLMLVVLGFTLIPAPAKADSGDTNYGKWYTSDEIKLKTQLEVKHSSDTDWQQTNYITMGADGSDTVQVRMTVTLDSPSQLSFAPDGWLSFTQDPRDGVKAGTRQLGVFGSHVFGLAGASMSSGPAEFVNEAGKKDGEGVAPKWKSVNIPVLQDSLDVPVFEVASNKGGEISGNCEVHSVVQSGGQIYNNITTIDKARLDKMTYKAGTVYDFKVWPNLCVNVGDVSLTEAVIAGGLTKIATTKLTEVGKIIGGIGGKAIAKLKSFGGNKTKAAESLAADIVADPANVAIISAEEAKNIAVTVLDAVDEVTAAAAGKLEATALEKISGEIIEKLMVRGLAAEDAMLVAAQVVGDALVTGTQTAAGVVTAAAETAALDAAVAITERAALNVAAASAEVAVKRGLTKTIIYASTKLLGKALTKALPFVGWAWAVVDLALYFKTFQKEPLPFYTNVSQDVILAVYATKDEAVAHKDDPPPAAVANKVTNGSKTGTGDITKSGGNALLGFLNQLIGGLVGLLQKLIYGIFYLLIVPLLQALLSIHTYTDTFAGVIYPGWQVVRNICNILFIIAIIIIAMATLFRVSSYEFRHLLVKLIIAALLVNFSLVIGQAVLGLADTVQSQFLPNSTEVIGGLGKDLMVESANSFNSLPVDKGTFSETVIPLFKLALAIGSFVVFAFLVGFLVIRIIALWVLLMVSPLAWAAGILPSTANMQKQWWSYFLKYAFFAPIMAFFLNITALINNLQNSNPVLKQISSTDFNGSNVAPFVFKVSSNILLLVFLMAAIKVAQQFGVIGAESFAKFTKGGLALPFVASGKGLKALGGNIKRTVSGAIGQQILANQLLGRSEEEKKIKAKNSLEGAQKNLDELRAKNASAEEIAVAEAEVEKFEHMFQHARKAQYKHAAASAVWRGLSLYDPHVVKEAWKKRAHEKEQRAYQPAIGAMVDTFNRIIPTENIMNLKRMAKGEFGKRTLHGLIAQRGVVSTEAKELKEGIRTREDAARMMRNAVLSGDKDEIEAAEKILLEGNWEDDHMNELNQSYSVIGRLSQRIEEKVHAGMNVEQIKTIEDDLKETSEGLNKPRNYGNTRMDDDGEVRPVTDFTYWQGLKREEQSSALNKLAEGFQEKYDKTKNEEHKWMAEATNYAAGEVRARRMSFNDALKLDYSKVDGAGNTVDRYAQAYGAQMGADFRRGDEDIATAWASRRFVDEANIKFSRGNIGGHNRGMEAALIAQQHPQEGWTGQNMVGNLMLNEYPTNGVKTMKSRMHETQGRFGIGLGALRDPITREVTMPNFAVINQSDGQIDDDSRTEANYTRNALGQWVGGDPTSYVANKRAKLSQRKQHRMGLHRFIQSSHNRRELAETLIDDRNEFFEAKVLKDFVDGYDVYRNANATNPDLKLNKIETVTRGTQTFFQIKP